MVDTIPKKIVKNNFPTIDLFVCQENKYFYFVFDILYTL